MKNTIISDKSFGEERALYNLQNTRLERCGFEGAEDGESALKEARSIEAEDCRFLLRYPLWHVTDFLLMGCFMDTTARAALWYAEGGKISGSTLNGIKCLRECRDVALEHCKVSSAEFGWKCRDITIKDCEMQSEYFLFESENLKISGLEMKGKYSFQYVSNMTIENSMLDTKDAFWHSRGVTVRDSVIKGEYLGWYSEGLTLINCKITGTQPLCYCKGLTLQDCTMEQTDLAFEYSEVIANIRGNILSVKNPKSGSITADSIGEIINEGSVVETDCKITIR